jgi:hypothetical protein
MPGVSWPEMHRLADRTHCEVLSWGKRNRKKKREKMNF